MSKAGQKQKSNKTKSKKTSRTRQPDGMSLEAWQIALRREYGREQSFRARNLGTEPVYSEFGVTNPKSGRTYRVAIRGDALGVNFCSCPDFAVNALGTCKHIEWLIARLKRKHGVKKTFAKLFLPAFTEVYLEYGAQRRVRFRAGFRLSDASRRLAANYFDENGLLRDDAFRNFEAFVHEARKAEDDVRIYDDALEFIARLRDDANRRAAIHDAFEKQSGIPQLNGLLRVTMYPYQQQGALFAAKAGRCLIADDMGLGKTIQAIAASEILARASRIERVLVVCPTALKYQWQLEIERFTNRSSIVIDGLKPARDELYREDSFYKITNYESVQRDLASIDSWRPDLVILDEAQRIKNWETRRAKAVKQIDSAYAIVLTGTPLENRLAELHSIMEFVDKFHLGPLFRFLSNHQQTDESGKVIGYRELDRIKQSLAPVLLRRHKRDVLQELPPRTDKHLFVEMTEPQRTIHDENRDVVTQIVAKWRRRGFLTDQEQRRLMIAMQYMRMSCNNTYLIDKLTDQGPKIDECAFLLDDLLANPENKAVIFSQWLGTHELLIRRFEAQNRPFAYYHGSLDSKARKKAIDDFKRDRKCGVLLCTDSGGVGLNLQEACVVINMDQPWNPAVLEQRIARVHRLGQQRNVQVYHFVSRGTIEYGMLGVLKFKSSLAEGVLDGGESEIFLGGTKMKQFMESIEQVANAIPAAPYSNGESKSLQADTSAAPPAAHKSVEPPADSNAAQTSWDGLLTSGLQFLAQLGQTLQPTQPQHPANFTAAGLIARNESTGQPELRIPLPSQETAEKLSALLTGLGELFKANAATTPTSHDSNPL